MFGMYTFGLGVVVVPPRDRAMGPDAETCWGSLGAFINNCVLTTSPTQQLVLNTMQLAQSQPGKQLCLIKK